MKRILWAIVIPMMLVYLFIWPSLVFGTITSVLLFLTILYSAWESGMETVENNKKDSYNRPVGNRKARRAHLSNNTRNLK